MPLRPDRTLAARFPDIAAQWHPSANDPLGIDPTSVSAHSPVKVTWRCPAGHEWVESPHVRTLLPAWKRGERAACRVCVGYHSVITFECGHTAAVQTEHARQVGACPACRRTAWEQREEAIQRQRLAVKAVYDGAKDEAEELVASIPLPAELPGGLVHEWRIEAVTQVRKAIAAERELGKEQEVEATVRRLARRLGKLVPSQGALKLAIARNEPVVLGKKAHWPAGWLYHSHGARPALAHHGDGYERMVTSLEQALRRGLVEQRVELVQLRQKLAASGHQPPELDQHTSLSTAQLTRLLTELVARWAGGGRHSRTLPRPYRELSVPVTPAGSARFGRLDVTVLRRDAPDVVVEIDSAANAGTEDKLAFARDAGAVTVWVRWKAGTLTALDGVHLIDLREATRELLTPTQQSRDAQ
jgi:Probable Zinc-ribbon domain